MLVACVFRVVLGGVFTPPSNTSPEEGLRITRPGGGNILPPAISAPGNARNTKLGGGQARIKLCGANFLTLGQHLQGHMTS